MNTSKIQVVNPDTGKKVGEVNLDDNHVEEIAVEQRGVRLFANLTQSNKLAVINRKTMKLIAEWPIPPAKQNAMIALDELRHRIFLVCRDPGMVVVLNSDTGAVTNYIPAQAHVDDVVLTDRRIASMYLAAKG